jgi:outer membrane immunogenic protein
MKGRLMRRITYALILLSLASPAAAADLDFDFLRGSETVGPGTYTRWSGFYVGGQLGYGWATTDFSGSTASLISYVLRESDLETSVAPSQWPILGTGRAAAPLFGGFVGYNMQFEDAIFGVEANLEYGAFKIVSPNNPIARSTGADSSGNAYTVNMTGSGEVDTMDFLTFKARAGYVVGNFMPYGFAGFALGLANTSVSATISGTEYTSGTIGSCTSACIPYLYTGSYVHNNDVLYGYTVGGGVDVALTPNVFARVELELDQFILPNNLELTAMTAHVGAGYKF